jgi:hypothetical protein
LAILISFSNSNGRIGRCDANCYNATNTKCTCICGGKNHGVGLTQARDNTAQQGALWLDRWEAQHPNDPPLRVAIKRLKPRPLHTMPLFPDIDGPPPKAA